jgi:AcrR family transcriptional regulator
MAKIQTPQRRTQAERRAETQGRLLDAAIECLVERGYPGTSTAEVCRRAGASKGALVHHYPTKADLLAAAVERLFFRRLEEFRAGFAGVDRGDPEQVFAAIWSIYTGPTLPAYQELVVAARTDADLRAKVTDLNARFSADAQVAFRDQFGLPEGVDVEAPTRLLLAVFDGLALNQIVEQRADLAPQVLALFRQLLAPWLEAAVEEASQ